MMPNEDKGAALTLVNVAIDQTELHHIDYSSAEAEQNTRLRYDMANILSVMNLRLFIIRHLQALEGEETEIFEQCINRLNAVLKRWEALENSGNHREVR